MQQRAIHHLAELRSLDGSGARVGYVLNGLWRTGQSIWTRAARRAFHEARPRKFPTRPGSSLDARQVERAFSAYRLAIRQYRHRPYDGLITLIATEEWCARDPSLGWRTDNRVEIHRIPGKHDTAYLEQAHLIADVLRASIQSAEIEIGAAPSSPAPSTPPT